ncbi:hypothetical protein ACFVYV_01505 [Streptomyces mirabilis]|uniref:hypothetical protein n=1 Tax=Streptomyces mirabilis TaxID=68239 RepID=UPI0036DE3DE2
MIPSQPLMQCAAGALADVGADFLTELLDDPAQAIKRARELAGTGEVTVDQILDDSGPPVPTGCGDRVRVWRQSTDRPSASLRWLWRIVHMYTRPLATSRRGFFEWRGTQPRVRGLIYETPLAVIKLR